MRGMALTCAIQRLHVVPADHRLRQTGDGRIRLRPEATGDTPVRPIERAAQYVSGQEIPFAATLLARDAARARVVLCARLMRLPRPGGSFAALDVAAVADQFRVRIERPVIIYLIGQARILAIITAIIAAAWREAITFGVRAFSILLNHHIPPSSSAGTRL